MSSASVAWVERSETRVGAPPTAADPDFAPLNPGYLLDKRAAEAAPIPGIPVELI